MIDLTKSGPESHYLRSAVATDDQYGPFEVVRKEDGVVVHACDDLVEAQGHAVFRCSARMGEM